MTRGADVHRLLADARRRAEREAPGDSLHRARRVAEAAARYHDAVARSMRAAGRDDLAVLVEARGEQARRRAAIDAAEERRRDAARS